jgi:CHAT domain-containing protein
VVVGRRRQHRIDIRFALGDITEADSRAIALGVYRSVAPSGPALAVDARLGGAITEMVRRRMFSAGVGEVFNMSTGRHPIAADLITLVGLGSFDRFNDQVLQTAAENVLRAFVNSRVEEFATVLFGAGSGESPASALQNLLAGFFSGLRDADRDHRFRRIVVCERDPRRYVQLKEELYRLSSTALCHDVEITFDEMTLPRPLEAPVVARRVRREDPIYLIVRQEGGEGDDDTPYDVRSSVLTAGAKATVVTGVRQVKRGEFEQLRKRIVDGRKAVDDDSLKLGSMLLAGEVRAVLPSQRDRHLVIVHDGPTSRVPWETLALSMGEAAGGDGVWFPSAERGMSRRYAADNLSVAKWLEERVEDGVLNVLLVVNPTGDLEGAQEEGHRVQELFRSLPSTKLDELWGKDATRPALLSRFGSGKYDIIHYAGHAFFDEASPERSGILCHNHVPISGVDLAQLTNLPTLVFFNACESGRLRRSSRGLLVADEARARKTRLEHVRDAVGLAEAFLRGGVSVFVGTYWPVGDTPAKMFADTFYSTILKGEPIGDAVLAGRKAVKASGAHDWANYILYGSQDFVIKELGSPAASAMS